ncbi:MAG: hypothetical protein HUJ16_02800, partial [Kangiella sp.]|nr:hypothetical protein [Kangiella sp.]
ILFGITAWANFATAASTPEDCAAITNDTKRLACYDQFIKNKPAPAKPEPVAQPAEPAEPAKPTMPEQAQTPAPKENVVTKEDRIEEFGKERLREEGKLDSLTATAIGSFHEWKNGLEIELDNGQVWEIVDSRKGYYKIQNPTVIIEKGFMNSYRMQVKGRNQRYSVTRIK